MKEFEYSCDFFGDEEMVPMYEIQREGNIIRRVKCEDQYSIPRQAFIDHLIANGYGYLLKGKPSVDKGRLIEFKPKEENV